MRKPLFAIAGLALLASGAFASVATVGGADHRDSPLPQANATADINDVYIFRSPTNANNAVLVTTLNPLIAPSDNATRGNFDPTVQYQIHIDRNGDLADDYTVNIRMTTGPDNIVIEAPGMAAAARITPPGQAPIITEVGPIKIFAGLRDDPFFFDLTAFQAFIANPTAPARGLRPASAGAPADTFAGVNTLALVAELPVPVLTGGTSSTAGVIKAWVSTTRNGRRIDRMGIPAINTALIPSAQKDAFNAADPINDAATFRSVAQTTITGLRNAVDPLFGGSLTQQGGPLGNLSAAAVAGALIPDVVTVDFSKAVQFPNGRRLQDDVIDAALGLVLNRGGAAGIADGVGANDKDFLSAFPYLADPHTAAASGGGGASGGGSVTPPRTGDGGLADESTMWTLSAVLLAASIACAGAGTLVAVRGRNR